MEILSFIFAWYNLPYTLLLGLCVFLGGLQILGLGGGEDHDTEADHDLDHDVDHDIDHDVDHDIDQDVDHDLDHDADADADHDVDHDADHDVAPASSSVSAFSILAFLGVGRAPLLVVILLLCGSVGLLGWALNALLLGLVGGALGFLVFLGTLPFALIGGVLISSRTARFIGNTLPPISTTATGAQALVGRQGTVISPFVDEKYGQVHLRNPGGTLISIFAVVENEPPIKRGEKVVLVEYTTAQRRYIVTRARTEV